MPTEPAFLARLVLSGFVGVWLDRYGYDPAELGTLEDKLAASLGPPLVGGLAQRYAFYDLSRLQPPSDASGRRRAFLARRRIVQGGESLSANCELRAAASCRVSPR